MGSSSAGQTRPPLVIGLGGGTGSGKSTIADAIVAEIGRDEVVVLHHDAYYRDQRDIPFEQRVKVNYDHPDSLETELLVAHVHELLAWRAIDKPVYDFTRHTRSDRTERVLPEPVILVEGILVLAEPELRSLMDLKLYVDTDPDLRLIRRLQRDITERGRTAESVVEQYLATARPMHFSYVEPSKQFADLVIPGGYNPPAVAAVTSRIREFLRAH